MGPALVLPNEKTSGKPSEETSEGKILENEIDAMYGSDGEEDEEDEDEEESDDEDDEDDEEE